MILLPRKRRVKETPNYIGVSVESKSIVIPKDFKANEEAIENMARGATKSYETVPTSINDTKKTHKRKIDIEMLKYPHTAAAANIETETTIDLKNKSSSKESASLNFISRCPLNFNVDFVDLVFELQPDCIKSGWTDSELEESRRIITFDRSCEDDAVSIWHLQGRELAPQSISYLLDPDSNLGFLSLYDLQRLLGFIADIKLSETTKRRLHEFLDKNRYRIMINSSSALFSKVMNMKRHPRPIPRRNMPLWVIQWRHLETILERIFKAEGVNMTILQYLND